MFFRLLTVFIADIHSSFLSTLFIVRETIFEGCDMLCLKFKHSIHGLTVFAAEVAEPGPFQNVMTAALPFDHSVMLNVPIITHPLHLCFKVKHQHCQTVSVIFLKI